MAFSAVFSNFDQCQPEGADNVISDVIVDWVGVDGRVELGDSMLNNGRIIRLRFIAQYSVAFFSRPGAHTMPYPAGIFG